jgi:hypothetical protein
MDDLAPYTGIGGFIVGSILGFTAALRLFRIALDYIRKSNGD